MLLIKVFNTRFIQIGVNVHGLYLEGCRWDIQDNQLGESKPGVLFEDVPVIWYFKTFK